MTWSSTISISGTIVLLALAIIVGRLDRGSTEKALRGVAVRRRENSAERRRLQERESDLDEWESELRDWQRRLHHLERRLRATTEPPEPPSSTEDDGRDEPHGRSGRF